MNKVVTINLNGVAFQLEESGYEALRAYLESATRRLEGNPDKDEILADIEQAIADKCRAALGAYKTVVLTAEVATIVAAMGPVEDASASGGDPPPAAGDPRPDPGAAEREFGGPMRRLYVIHDGAMIGGVCNGIAAYIGIDVTIVRLAFVVLAFASFGVLALAYLVMMVVVPSAETPAEKAAAYGGPSTAQDFIRRAKDGYYEGFKTFADKRAHREWRRRFHREMRGWRRAFRHEMSAHADEWRRHWRHRDGFGPAFGLTLPLLSLVRWVLACLGLCALVSLLATGAVFGLLLPAGLPVWAAIVLLLIAYKLATWPIRVARRACRWHGAVGLGWGYPLLAMTEAIASLGFVALLIWLGWHHAAQIREAVANIPSTVREAIAAIDRWWRRR